MIQMILAAKMAHDQQVANAKAKQDKLGVNTNTAGNDAGVTTPAFADFGKQQNQGSFMAPQLGSSATQTGGFVAPMGLTSDHLGAPDKNGIMPLTDAGKQHLTSQMNTPSMWDNVQNIANAMGGGSAAAMQKLAFAKSLGQLGGFYGSN